MDEPLVPALPSTELPESRIRRVRVDEVEVLVARLTGGDVVAFATACPHQRTDLEGASLVDGLVQCPLHAYVYDPRTGENVEPTAHAEPGELWRLKPGYLPVHPVEERAGWIWVGRRPQPPPPSYDAATEQPPVTGWRPAEPLGTAVLRVAAGATFELRLPTTPQPACVWRVDPGGPAVAVVGQRSERGDHVVRLAARNPGRVTVRCSYARPWDREPAEVRTFEVHVTAAR